MGSNTSVTFTADIADLKVKALAASAILKQTEKDWTATSKAILAGDTSPEMAARNLQLAQTWRDNIAVVQQFSRAKRASADEDRNATAAADAFIARLKEEAATVNMSRQELLAYKAQQLGVADQAKPLIAALGTQTEHMVSSRAATEGLVLVHEAIRGNYTRMTGSAMILGQALAGQEMVTKAITAATTPMGIAIIGATAAIGAITVAEMQYEASTERLIGTTVGLAAASGLTAEQLRAAGDSAAEYSGASIKAATESASAFAAAGVRSQAVVASLAGSMQVYASLTGQEAAEAQKTLAAAMQDPIKGANDLNAQLGLLDQTQLEQIRTMVEAGDKTGAVAVITDALRHRTDEAKASGAAVNSTWQDMTSSLSDMWTWLGKVSDGFDDLANKYSLFNLQTGGYDREQAAKAAAAAAAQTEARNKQASVVGGQLYDATPEGQAAAKRTELSGNVAKAQEALRADIALRGEHSEAVAHDRATITAYQRALDTYLPSAEKAHRLAELDAQLAAAKRGHDASRVADLTRQKAALDTAGEVMSPAEAAQRAADAGAVGGAKTGSGSHHDETVAKWAEALHAQEIASKDYFSDQTANELAFWQSKVSLTQAGTRNWLEVQAHIFEASKTLARQDYQDRVADLNDKIQADRDNWSKEQADWAEKLAYIKSKFGEQSTEYKNAHRELERAQQEHDQRELTETERHIREQSQLIKRGLDDDAKARDEAAKAEETRLKANAGGSLMGDISAEKQVAQIHAQLTAQKIADNETLHTAESAMLDAAITAAKAKYGEDESAYRALIDAKRAEDQRYADEKRTLDAQAKAQQATDLAQLQAKYHGYVDGTVSTVVSGFNRMLAGSMNFKQFGASVFQSIATTAEQQVAKMASDWIVKHLLMAAASKLLGQGQMDGALSGASATVSASKTAVAALAGQAGAAGVASMAAAPWPLDMTAPAFGAAMEAAAIGLGSFAQGANVLPSDMIAQVHAGERIVPAADNARLIELTARGAGRGGGGDTNHYHLHYGPTINGQMPFPDQLAAHEDVIISLMQRAARRGVRFAS